MNYMEKGSNSMGQQWQKSNYIVTIQYTCRSLHIAFQISLPNSDDKGTENEFYAKACTLAQNYSTVWKL